MKKPSTKNKSLLTKRFNCRFDDQTFNELEEKVKASGLSKSEFIRDYVLKNKTQVVARPPMTEDKKRVHFILNKTSNNINQLAKSAHIAHISGKVSDDTFSGILKELEHITQLMKLVANNAG